MFYSDRCVVGDILRIWVGLSSMDFSMKVLLKFLCIFIMNFVVISFITYSFFCNYIISLLIKFICNLVMN